MESHPRVEKLAHVFPRQFPSPTSHVVQNKFFLACKESLYKPEVQSTVAAQVVKKRKLAKCYHDVNVKPLPSLHTGQPVPQQPRSDWKADVILKNVAPRSYMVEVISR